MPPASGRFPLSQPSTAAGSAAGPQAMKRLLAVPGVGVASLLGYHFRHRDGTGNMKWSN